MVSLSDIGNDETRVEVESIWVFEIGFKKWFLTLFGVSAMEREEQSVLNSQMAHILWLGIFL